MFEDRTEIFYRVHSRQYYESTRRIDPAPFLAPFARILPKGCRILDVGCGSGRDLKWLGEKGFEVCGFERSPELAGLARRHSGCEVAVGDLEAFDFAVFDVQAILLAGSLAHLPPGRLQSAFRRIVKAIRRPPGHIFLSLKKWDGRQIDGRGRIFYLWEEPVIRELLEDESTKLLSRRTNRSDFNPQDQWLSLSIQRENDRAQSFG